MPFPGSAVLPVHTVLANWPAPAGPKPNTVLERGPALPAMHGLLQNTVPYGEPGGQAFDMKPGPPGPPKRKRNPQWKPLQFPETTFRPRNPPIAPSMLRPNGRSVLDSNPQPGPLRNLFYQQPSSQAPKPPFMQTDRSVKLKLRTNSAMNETVRSQPNMQLQAPPRLGTFWTTGPRQSAPSQRPQMTREAYERERDRIASMMPPITEEQRRRAREDSEATEPLSPDSIMRWQYSGFGDLPPREEWAYGPQCRRESSREGSRPGGTREAREARANRSLSQGTQEASGNRSVSRGTRKSSTRRSGSRK
jgi:hypothetical protein